MKLALLPILILFTVFAGEPVLSAPIDRLPEILQTNPERDKRDKAARKAEEAWAQRVFIQPFRARLKGEPWNAQATAFVDNAVASWIDPSRWGARHHYRGLAEFAKDGTDLLNSECKDPLVMYLASLAIDAGDQDPEGARKAIDRAKKDIEKADVSNALRRFVFRFSFFLKARQEGHYSKTDIVQDATFTNAAWKDGKSYLPEEAAIFVEHECGGYAGGSLSFADEYAKAYKDLGIPEWAQLTLDGTVEMNRGWAARGDGYANTVTQKGWKSLEEHLAAAKEMLTKAWKLNPNEPHAANKMISVARGGGADESPFAWFERSVAARFDQREAYEAILITVQPRWGGNEELSNAFARAFLATKRFDTAVPLMYRVAVEDLSNPQIAADFRTLYEGLRDEPTRREQRAYWSQWLAAYAALGHDEDRAIKAFADAGGKFGHTVQKIISMVKVEPEMMAAELHLGIAKQLPRFRAAEVALKDGKIAEVLTELDAIEKAAGPNSKTVLAGLRAAAEFERDLATGKPVPVRFADGLPGWTRRWGKWNAENGALICKGTNMPGSILAPGRAGSRYTVKGKLDIKCPFDAYRQFMLIAGMTFANPADPDTLSFGAYQVEKREAVGALYSAPKHFDIPDTKVRLQDTNVFTFKVDGSKVSMELNGAVVIPETDSSQFTPVPIGGRWGFYMPVTYKTNTWKIYDVEVQRLP